MVRRLRMFSYGMLRKNMYNMLKISIYTIRDQTRHKSFYLLLGIAILFVLLIRGCYEGNYTVNGQQVDNTTVAWHASKMAFHAIAIGMLLLVTVLAMRMFSRDQDDGSLILFLSRATTRRQYILGRVAGTWLLSTLFMFILHLTIFLTAWSKTGGVIPGYLTASWVCSLNLLFITLLVCVLSLHMPDFIAAIATIGIIVIGFTSDGIHQIMQSNIVQSALPDTGLKDPSLWRILYPKIAHLQQYAVSLIDKSDFSSMGPLHPALNVLLYSLITGALLVWSFSRREI